MLVVHHLMTDEERAADLNLYTWYWRSAITVHSLQTRNYESNPSLFLA